MQHLVKYSLVTGFFSALAVTCAHAQQPIGSRFVVSINAGVAHESEDNVGTIPLITLRGTYRLPKEPDFSVFAEITEGRNHENIPELCVVSLCNDYFGGAQRLRMWHVGMETRIAGYRAADRKRVMFGAGVGQYEYRNANRNTGLMPKSRAKFSVQTSVALEAPVANHFGVRAAGIVYLSSLPFADEKIAGVWEVFSLHVGLTYNP